MAGDTETLADRVQDAIHDAWVEGAEAHKLATYDASEARQKAVELAAALRGSAPPTGPSVSENLIAYCDARIEKLLVARDKAKEAGRVGVERCRQSDIETLLEVREVVLAETARAAAAEQPRTVEREAHPLWVRLYDAVCGNAHTSPPFHDTLDDTPPETREVSDAMNAIHAFYGGHPWATDPNARGAAAPEGSPAPEPQCDFWYPNHGVERRCELARGHSGYHVLPGSAGPFRRPNVTEPRTQERETIPVEHLCGEVHGVLEALTIDAEEHGDNRWHAERNTLTDVCFALAALRTPAPSGEAEVREWWEMPGMLLKGETLEQNLRRSREAQGERTTTRNEGEGS